MATINLLAIEDSKNDIELLRYTLKKAGIDFVLKQVQTEEELRIELSSDWANLILSDNSLPKLDGDHAFDIVRAHSPSLPFIVFSGAPEERIQAMKDKGAAHCIAKSDLNLLPNLILECLARKT